MPDLLTVDGLTKRFAPDAPPVVDDVSFRVAPGEFFALLGPSGCGKTTTLRLIAGFERPDAGRIACGGQAVCEPGRRVPAERRGVGFVFQDYALFPHLSVAANVRFGLRGRPRRERDARTAQLLEGVGLDGLAERRPDQLSGGQQQRVALARALAPSPRLLLLDEPFSGLDALLRQTTRLEVRRLLEREGVGAVLVTHDQEEAFSLADRVAVMNAGRIEQIGAPETLFRQPRTRFVAEFLGPTNLISAHADGDRAQTPLGPVRLDRQARGDVLVALRPESLALLPPSDPPIEGPSGRVLARTFRGRDVVYRVDCSGGEYLAYAPSQAAFRPGDRVALCACEPAVVLESP
jgi:iron(III) transport system ATP-binding protein